MQAVLKDKQAIARVATNIDRMLRERGMSQRALAHATGETEMSISRLRRGKNEPGVGILSRVAEALGTSIDSLLSPPPKKNSSRSA